MLGQTIHHNQLQRASTASRTPADLAGSVGSRPPSPRSLAKKAGIIAMPCELFLACGGFD